MTALRGIPAARPHEVFVPPGRPESQPGPQTRKYSRSPRAERVAVERWDDEGGAGAGGRPQAPDLPAVG